MEFQTHNDTVIDVNMTSLQGQVIINYHILDAIFGEPMRGDGHKVDAEWHVRFEDGTVATIYNCKNGQNYLGADGQPVYKISTWNIGGFNHRAAELVNQTVHEAVK